MLQTCKKNILFWEPYLKYVCSLLQLHPFEGNPAPDSGSKSIDSLALSAHQYPASERCLWFTGTCINVCFVRSFTVLKQKCASHTFLLRHRLSCALSFQTHGSVHAASIELSGTLTWGETWHCHVEWSCTSLSHNYLCLLLPLWGHTHMLPVRLKASPWCGEISVFFPTIWQKKTHQDSWGLWKHSKMS